MKPDRRIPDRRIPDCRVLVEPVAAYLRRHPAGGACHIVFDDGNYGDSALQVCIEFAEREGDAEAAELMRKFQLLSPTQRAKVTRLAHAITDHWDAARFLTAPGTT